MSLTLLDAVGHVSFLLTALSFFVRDMIVLRGLAIVSGLVGVGTALAGDFLAIGLRCYQRGAHYRHRIGPPRHRLQ